MRRHFDADKDFDDSESPTWRIRHRPPWRRAFDRSSPAKLFVLSFFGILALLTLLPATLFTAAIFITWMTGT